MTDPEPLDDARTQAHRRAAALAGLLWHLGAFVIINSAFWLMDATLGDPAVTWAYWITATWGFALAFHVLSYAIDGRQLVDRRTEKYLGDGGHEGR